MRKSLPILFCVVLVIGVSAGVLLWYGSRTGGPRYNPRSNRDVQKLQAIAENGRPLREALERYKHDQGSYPPVVTNLFPVYLQPAPTPTEFHWAGWHYMRESTNSYSLYYKLNWDDGLFYEHQLQGTNRWYWSGSGFAETDLTGKFQ